MTRPLRQENVMKSSNHGRTLLRWRRQHRHQMPRRRSSPASGQVMDWNRHGRPHQHRRRRIQRRRSSDPSELPGLVEPSRLHDRRLGEKERDDAAGVEWGFLLLELGAEWMREGDDAGTLDILYRVPLRSPTNVCACMSLLPARVGGLLTNT